MLSDVPKTTGEPPSRGEAKVSPAARLAAGLTWRDLGETETFVFQGPSGKNGWTMRPHLAVFLGSVGPGWEPATSNFSWEQFWDSQSKARVERCQRPGRGRAVLGPLGAWVHICVC